MACVVQDNLQNENDRLRAIPGCDETATVNLFTPGEGSGILNTSGNANAPKKSWAKINTGRYSFNYES